MKYLETRVATGMAVATASIAGGEAAQAQDTTPVASPAYERVVTVAPNFLQRAGSLTITQEDLAPFQAQSPAENPTATAAAEVGGVEITKADAMACRDDAKEMVKRIRTRVTSTGLKLSIATSAMSDTCKLISNVDFVSVKGKAYRSSDKKMKKPIFFTRQGKVEDLQDSSKKTHTVTLPLKKGYSSRKLKGMKLVGSLRTKWAPLSPEIRALGVGSSTSGEFDSSSSTGSTGASGDSGVKNPDKKIPKFASVKQLVESSDTCVSVTYGTTSPTAASKGLRVSIKDVNTPKWDFKFDADSKLTYSGAFVATNSGQEIQVEKAVAAGDKFTLSSDRSSGAFEDSNLDLINPGNNADTFGVCGRLKD